VKRFSEYGKNYSLFRILLLRSEEIKKIDVGIAMQQLLDKSVAELDITGYQKQALEAIGIDSIGTALRSGEEDFQRARYIGPVRARRIMNTTQAAAFEYLSG